MQTRIAHDNLVHIETPESVWLTFRLAGPAARLAAYLLDLLLRILIIFMIGVTANVISGGSELSTGIILIGLFTIEWGYGCLFEAFNNGQTPGKKVFHLRVIKVGGYSLGFFDALLRNLLRAADALPPIALFFPTYGVGLIAMFCNQRNQRLGDLAAGTIVVQDRPQTLRRPEIPPEEIKEIPLGQLRSGSRPTEETLDLIASLYAKRRTLARPRREEIAAILADPLASRLGFEPEDANEQPHNNPELFLLRVLRTFHDRPEAATTEGSTPP